MPRVPKMQDVPLSDFYPEKALWIPPKAVDPEEIELRKLNRPGQLKDDALVAGLFIARRVIRATFYPEDLLFVQRVMAPAFFNSGQLARREREEIVKENRMRGVVRIPNFGNNSDITSMSLLKNSEENTELARVKAARFAIMKNTKTKAGASFQKFIANKCLQVSVDLSILTKADSLVMRASKFEHGLSYMQNEVRESTMQMTERAFELGHTIASLSDPYSPLSVEFGYYAPRAIRQAVDEARTLKDQAFDLK